jgi:hypothetical protein
MKNLKVVRVQSSDGELHFVLKESEAYEGSLKFKKYDEAEVKEATKREASRPLLLIREE